MLSIPKNDSFLMKSKEMMRAMKIHFNYHGNRKNQLQTNYTNWMEEALPLINPLASQKARISPVLFKYKSMPHVNHFDFYHWHSPNK